MLRLIVSTSIILFTASSVLAATLTPENLRGAYKVSARAGLMKVYLNFNVLTQTDFDIQRVHPNGQTDELCSGTYSLNSRIFWDFDSLNSGKIFKGVFTCPSRPSKLIHFDIDFKNTTTEDLVRGTNVTVTSSLAPGRSINAHVIKKD